MDGVGTAAVFWPVLGLVTLGTVLTVWLGRPEDVPNVFGAAGGIAVAAFSLVALMFTAAARGARRWLRLWAAGVTVSLSLAALVLAFARFARREGPADTGIAVVLTVGVLAMFAVAIGTLRGKRTDV
jgi:cell division protein FtsW (lipid II flippase)